MGFFDILMIGFGLSMDAAAVSMSNGMAYGNLRKRYFILIPLFYGFFQALMPCMGFMVGGFLASLIVQYAGVAVLIILGLIGINMMREGLNGNENENCRNEPFTLILLLAQAVATSIDAFAVGIGLGAMEVNIFSAAATIGLIAFAVSLVALLIGRTFGNILGCKAEILGGFLLITIAVKSIL